MKPTKLLAGTIPCLTVAAALMFPAAGAAADGYDTPEVNVEVFAPRPHSTVGVGGKGWFVDLAVTFGAPLAATGLTFTPEGEPMFQLTGPGPHNNVAPMPGTFSGGADDRFPGLVVLLSTTTVGAGPCMNLANLFNMTGVSHVDEHETEIWDTWIIGAPNFGVDTRSVLYVAVADDLNGDGIFNDAPGVVADADGNGRCDAGDLRAMGVASNITRTRFYINGEVDPGDLPMLP